MSFRPIDDVEPNQDSQVIQKLFTNLRPDFAMFTFWGTVRYLLFF